MSITQTEAVEIGKLIAPNFQETLEEYDFNKYPAEDYARFKYVFSALEPSDEDIKAAMIWKWGHCGKDNYPETHKKLIGELQQLWPKFVVAHCSTQTSYQTFEWWRKSLNRKTTYITIAYITHLIHHAEPLPIIDQHNYRAMNALIMAVRKPSGKPNKKPSEWADIESLKLFMTGMIAVNPHLTFSDLDRFLMMYGRNYVNH